MVWAVSMDILKGYYSKEKLPRTCNTQGLPGMLIQAQLGQQAACKFATETTRVPTGNEPVVQRDMSHT